MSYFLKVSLIGSSYVPTTVTKENNFLAFSSWVGTSWGSADIHGWSPAWVSCHRWDCWRVRPWIPMWESELQENLSWTNISDYPWINPVYGWYSKLLVINNHLSEGWSDFCDPLFLLTWTCPICFLFLEKSDTESQKKWKAMKSTCCE